MRAFDFLDADVDVCAASRVIFNSIEATTFKANPNRLPFVRAKLTRESSGGFANVNTLRLQPFKRGLDCGIEIITTRVVDEYFRITGKVVVVNFNFKVVDCNQA